MNVMQKGREKFPLAVSLGYPPGAGRLGYPSRPGNTFGNLPKIPGAGTSPAAQGYGVRLRTGSGLVPTVTGVPNMGAHPHIPTLPREKSQRLSSSDSRAMEVLRPASRESRRSHPRRSTADGALLGQGSRSIRVTAPPRRPPPSQSVQPRRLATAQPLPPLPVTTDNHGVGEEDTCQSNESSEETDSSTEGSEIFSEDESEAPPSRPGFESDLEKSAQTFEIPFPDTFNPAIPFPATIIQEQAQLDMERFAASAHASGLSARVDNIVRAFRIHGPLDRDLLSKALNEVVGLHPLLTAVFQRGKDRLYLQTSQGKVSVDLTSPIVGLESPQDLIMNARRKIFHLDMRTDLCRSDGNDGPEAVAALSVVSLGSSELSDSPGENRKTLLPPPRKSVTFGLPSISAMRAPHASPLPALSSKRETPDNEPRGALMRARLVPKTVQEHILVLSFPRVICDFWSSCLFVFQLTRAYARLEKSASYRPSLATMRIETKKQEVLRDYEKERAKRTGHHGRASGAARLLQKRATPSSFTPATPAKVQFQQVAQRESQLLKMVSKEKLWVFWENIVTATVRRQRGPNRVKVVPPVRIPSGLGEKMPSRIRPQTSRLRPLTARNRPTTAARRQGSVLVEMGMTREALEGPPALMHFIKVEEDVCASFRRSLPEDYLASIDHDEVLSLMCLGAYVLMLGRCCRGWGAEERRERRGDGVSERKTHHKRGVTDKPGNPPVSDPLQRYSTDMLQRESQACVVSMPDSPGRRVTRKTMMGERLDLGSFLLGVEVSLRDSNPAMTQGLFGPLTNNVGLRVNLSSCPTFAELVIALWKNLQLARNHGHFPFTTIAEEVGLIHGLPVRYSFLYHRDIVQLTDPDNFYFPETAIGVRGHGLARFGSTCYLTPLSTKMDDACHFELLLWEPYSRNGVSGGIRYQPQTIRAELVEAFGTEMCCLLAAVAEDPCRSLMDLAQSISPPFVSTSRMRSRWR